MYMGVSGAAIGQVLPYQQECGNIHDPYAVAVVKRGVIVGHVPRRKLSWIKVLQISTKLLP